MNENQDAGSFIRTVKRIQGPVGQIPGSRPVSATALGLKNDFQDCSCGHGPLVVFPNPEPPGLDIEISEFAGIPDRIVIHPEASLVKRGYQGTELTFGSAKDRGFEDPLFLG
jgi:hypothetical protein